MTGTARTRRRGAPKRSRTRKRGLLPALTTGALAIGLAGGTPAAGQDADAQTQIDNAMSAASSSVSAAATILTRKRDDAGAFVVLQVPADPDSMCFDRAWLD